jgi:hypothetical protein
MSNKRYVEYILLVALGVGLVAGCASLNLKSPKSWFPADDNKPQPPASVTAVWSPAMLARADGSHARGLGGRLMFYGSKGKEPIKVDGALVIYAYDDDVQDPNDARPIRKYVFTREQFTTHYSKSDLGHSYSVWIPWDRGEFVTKKMTLVARFSPAEGSAVVSEPVKASLPGPHSMPIEQASPNHAAQPTVQPASHQVAMPAENPAANDAPPNPGQMRTSTIRVPVRN